MKKHIAMRYYKFNRDRSLNPLQKGIKSSDKLSYLAKRNNLNMLDSFHFENQTWGALHKAWKGYVIAKNKDEPNRMKYYAIVIQKLERELGIKVSSFPELGLMALQFFRDNPEYTDRELTGEEVFKILTERDKDLLTKAYEGTYEEKKNENNKYMILSSHSNIFEYFHKPISYALYSAYYLI